MTGDQIPKTWGDRIVIGICLGLGGWWLQNQWTTVEAIESRYHEMNKSIGTIEAHHSDIKKEILELKMDIREHQKHHHEDWKNK